MRVLVSAQAPDIDAAVDLRFGRAAYFVLVDSETGAWAAQPNTGRGAARQGGATP
jgi:predicted Fe-Mo cluster-binding NifX family protein